MKKIISLLAIGLVALLAIGFVSAYHGDPTVLGPALDEERHLEMQTALENMDYESWSALMQGKGRVLEVINENNFEQFVEMHNARINGDLETADSIRNELGLGQGTRQGMKNGFRRENGFGKGNGPRQRQGNCLQ